MVDNQSLNRAALLLKNQPEALAQCGREGRSIRLSIGAHILRVAKCEIVLSLQAGPVPHRTFQISPERLGELSECRPPSGDHGPGDDKIAETNRSRMPGAGWSVAADSFILLPPFPTEIAYPSTSLISR